MLVHYESYARLTSSKILNCCCLILLTFQIPLLERLLDSKYIFNNEIKQNNLSTFLCISNLASKNAVIQSQVIAIVDKKKS